MARDKSPERVRPIYKSTLGPSAYAHRHSAPVYSFSRSLSEMSAKLFVDKDLAKHEFSIQSSIPGPGAYDASLHRSSSNCNASSPSNTRWAACSTSRAAMEGELPYRAPPGPGAYQASASQTLTRSIQAGFSRYSLREARQSTYVSREHERELYGMHSPGPATASRDIAHSCGKQLSSTKPTQPRCMFGRSSRFSDVSKMSNKLGPGHYDC